jgi:hypothetical protein
MALPANVSYCNVTGRFIRAVGDGADGDRAPDAVPLASLTVEFTPKLKPAVVAHDGEHVVIVIDKVIASTDSEGYLLGPDGTTRGVMLIASADTDLDPSGWAWECKVTGPMFPGPITTSFVTLPGEEIDLVSRFPVAPTPEPVPQWAPVTKAQFDSIAHAPGVVYLIVEAP